MRSLIAVTVMLLAFTVTTEATAEEWTTATLSQPRSSLAAVSAGGKVFFGGGSGVGYISSEVVDIYDTTSDTWSTATLSQGRTILAATSVGSKVFFAGGIVAGDDYSNVVDIYDTSTDIWSTATLSQERFALSATSAGGKVFFAGGKHLSCCEYSNVVDIYDTNTNTWSTATLSQARVSFAATAAGGKAFFAGGTVTGDVRNSNVVDIYDTATNIWSTATLSQARNKLAATSAGGKVFFAGGHGGSPPGPGPSNVVDIYDTATDTWSTASLSLARSNLSATSAQGKVFFAGGDNNSGISDVVDIYDTATDTWSTASLSQPHRHLAATSAGGKVFFGGGVFHGPSDVVDIFDPSPPTGPHVTDIRIGGFAWSGDAYDVPFGPNQLKPMPWMGTDTLSIVFNEQVDIGPGDLTVRASDGTVVGVFGPLTGDGPEPGTFEASWILPTPLGKGQWTIELPDTIANLFNNKLDGEWTDNLSTRSGDDINGGDFAFVFNILPGDVNQNGNVSLIDLVRVRDSAATDTSDPAYSVFADIDRDGAIDRHDLVLAIRNYGVTTTPLSPSQTAVPEPSTMLLLLIGTVGIAGGWRRRRVG